MTISVKVLAAVLLAVVIVFVPAVLDGGAHLDDANYNF